ncbi:cytochrome c biogenesis protein CcsA [Fimbriimonas ginsengisoli]|uniref:Cytochrome c heme lyase subunit CcmF n=1 Tax=Fimbriimonas ginsengisoli Gsoil 348 TaxID=661478 RepID=A0A068NUU4_FIMGI|nr:cytochrome c biogenesis protein CcsA [Fimbriimonas ginsengisoli]AIE87313.1 Cytochrome c heme lyase subunit CcmF [Fimbriimonas ginsengisoli Gsoil 348]
MNQDPLAGFPTAPAWSLFVGPLGKGLVIAGLVFFALSAILSGLSARSDRFKVFATIGFYLGAVSLFGAVGCLTSLFVNNQFEYDYVFNHGDVHTALQYKIAGVWSGQQGSFLLWATTSAIFGLLALRGTGHYRSAYLTVYSTFLGTLCGILAYETPFKIIPQLISNGKVVVPPTGQGLAPSLMNYWVVIHPPTIFMGFGALTVLFAYAVAAIVTGDVRDWVSRVRPWSLVATGILGLGICMGGFWAYETLGWGGFWKWDPVENASFVPWLFLVTFVHGIMVQVSRKRWHGMNLVLGAIPFIAFVYGTFLTRSGFLENVSVHSFAEMDKSALKILEIFLSLVFFGFFALYAFRGAKLGRAANAEIPAQPGIGREGLYGTGILFLSLLAFVLAMGMSWPLIMALSHRQVAAVEEALYHMVVVWFFIPVMIGIAVTPFVSWRPLGGREILRRLTNVFSASVALTGAILLALRFPEWGVRAASASTVTMPFGLRMATLPWVAILLLTCCFAFVGNLWRIVETMKRSKSSLGGFFTHLGIAVLFAGLIVSRGLEQTNTKPLFVRDGTPDGAFGYTVAYKDRIAKSPEDRDGKIAFTVTAPGGETFTATPGLYFQRAMDGGEGKPMVWPFIRRYAAHDFYLSMGAPIVTVWEKPIWFKPGETKTEKDITITYRGMKMTGQPGTPSAVFGADILFIADGKVANVTPQFSVANGPNLPLATRDFRVALMQMDAKDKSVALQVYFSTALYPIEIFTKPLTGLVWLGAGMIFVGGFLSAFLRRRRKIQDVVTETPTEIEEPSIPDATVAVA